MGTKVKREFPSHNSPIDVVQEASELNCQSLSDPKCISAGIYEEEWEKLYSDGLELKMTRNRALCGGLRACRLRSVSWMLLLGALTPRGDWASELESARSYYSRLKHKLQQASTLSPNSSPSQDNPLSQNDQSSWHQYFCDRELRSVIRQDVIRTFPGVDFFRDPAIQEVMVNVLFCYARENPTMCYRQGMHEVLAPLLFVLHCDHQALIHTQELLAQVSGSISSIDWVQRLMNYSTEICVLLDPRFLEEDSYTLFRRVMASISSWYLLSDVAPTSTGYFPPRSNNSKSSTENQVLSQLNWIKETLLAPKDLQLYRHLEQLDIPLPLFGIRWLRLLFGREFPLQDLLVLWDAIFADGSDFDLVNYIVVAMLVAIRNHLLSSDYTSCLTLLMRYPGSVDISFIIEYALHLKNPKRYNSPTMKAMVPRLAAAGAGAPRRVEDKQTHHNKKPPESTKRNSHLSSSKIKNSSSAGGGRGVKQPGEETRRMRPPFTATPQSQNSIVDGYTLDDPALIMAELRHAYALMSLCRIKLEQYYTVLERVIPDNDIPAQEAITGIHELCSLMEIRGSTTVEPATEAGESNLSSSGKTLSTGVQSSSISSSGSGAGGVTGKASLVDMKVFKQSLTPFIDGPVSLPPHNRLY